MIMMALGRRKPVVLLALFLTVAVGVTVVWRTFRVSDMALIGAGYAAEQTCACLFIAGRSLQSCQSDLDPLAQKLISIKPGDHEVTASGFGLSSATARWEKGFGCTLQN